MKSLSGLVCIRQGNSLDYCWKEAIKSILPVCDSVVVCDGESTDGTQEEIREWIKSEPKIFLCVYPWKNPVGDIGFWTDWLNYAREHCQSELILQLDGDEVLSEESYAGVIRYREMPGRFTICFDRFNFYKDTRHLIPPGVCLSHRVYRMGPQNVWLPSDGPDPRGAEWVGLGIQTNLQIFHYGYLRKPEAFFKKSRELHKFFFNTYDSRLEEAEKEGRAWMEKIQRVEWRDNLIEFNGKHPAIIKDWLEERGYSK